MDIDYKNTTILRNFVTERGKMISARSTGNCSKHHRMLTRAVKRARNLALLPYAVV
jgi:small subunit ribosomal protein S18